MGLGVNLYGLVIVDQDCSQKDLMEDLRKGIQNIEKLMGLRVQSPGL